MSAVVTVADDPIARHNLLRQRPRGLTLESWAVFEAYRDGAHIRDVARLNRTSQEEARELCLWIERQCLEASQ